MELHAGAAQAEACLEPDWAELGGRFEGWHVHIACVRAWVCATERHREAGTTSTGLQIFELHGENFKRDVERVGPAAETSISGGKKHHTQNTSQEILITPSVRIRI